MEGSRKRPSSWISFFCLCLIILLNLQPSRAVGNASSTAADLYHLSSLEYDYGVAELPTWASASTRRVLGSTLGHPTYKANNPYRAAFNCDRYGNCINGNAKGKPIPRPCLSYYRCRHP